jgi:hypothetical protein
MFSNSYHLSAKVFSRQTSSCAATLAYRVGFPLRDPHDRLMKYPHRRPGGIQTHFVVNWTEPGRTACGPGGYQDILDEIGRTERRINSRMFREIETALPNEGTDEQRADLTEKFAGALCRRYGIPVIVPIHVPPNKKTGNHHGHLLLLTREVERDSGRPRLGKKVRVLDHPKTIKIIRRLWQKMLNRYYRELGIDKTVSCESYETLGIGRIPTIHEGPGARIKNGERPRINDAIRALNNAASPLASSPDAVRADVRKTCAALRKEVQKTEIQISALKKQIRHNLAAAKLNSRQKKQAATLKQLVTTAMSECKSAPEFSEFIKEKIGRGAQGRNAFYRLRKSIPPAGGDNEVQDARDGVELLALLFETENDDVLKKLKRWAAGTTLIVTPDSLNLDDPFVLDRLSAWEILAEEDKQSKETPPPAGGGDMKMD